MRLEGWHLIIIIVLALVLFAAPKLPSMARSIGQSMRIFKSEVREMKKDGSSEAKDSQDSSNPVEGKVVGHPDVNTKNNGETDVPPANRV
ncbi:Sec-independent protein translocase subunit TatA [Paenarthrobacter aurescens]|uniref:Sec-independent protein translocase protein TatA n=1 Tax=Paenarthrobacter aurescens TaxID=43663 RepID=A0A4Y3NBK6_PAEAU|nr:Sec-independent protein translocase subunit TatA [Paenarthrobacter aurescens]MDO6143630.1 Sec-independent protein translocase subunit TatA [Paenarthrobacter aurescens]MDO6147478.1 Sec-independent protein translocase subunit TatA [Paenarthrobacter aurescens]MDO6158721.1 Sec-independent protein translocase subunit TatA [Paenarthrobacter aurescens]MDO6162705.1 Sec-independent protein translocase subunit TatA [Paenarthrobacter aurescens]GEB19280.1 Sec-independent protein translocase protein Tat